MYEIILGLHSLIYCCHKINKINWDRFRLYRYRLVPCCFLLHWGMKSGLILLCPFAGCSNEIIRLQMNMPTADWNELNLFLLPWVLPMHWISSSGGGSGSGERFVGFCRYAQAFLRSYQKHLAFWINTIKTASRLCISLRYAIKSKNKICIAI